MQQKYVINSDGLLAYCKEGVMTTVTDEIIITINMIILIENIIIINNITIIVNIIIINMKYDSYKLLLINNLITGTPNFSVPLQQFF